jgi:BirA family transcriptional regulator, biotin operon repressor / biotin---[acetyl-CoA-carboxylase] ligase
VSAAGAGPGTSPVPGWEGRDPHGWADVLGIPLLELHPSLPSTNDRLRTLAEDGAAPFTTVVADLQTRGRGRGGKRWHSPGGTGLWMSVLLPLPPSGGGGVTTLAAGMAVAEAVEAVTGRPSALKWPNDLFLPVPAGRPAKAGGVLCERPGELGGIVAGIGINLRPVALPLAGSTSVEEATGRVVSPPELARRILDGLRRWADPPPDGVTVELRRGWAARDLLAGVEVESETEGRGRGVGLAPDGGLLLRMENGAVRTVRGGSIHLREG